MIEPLASLLKQQKLFLKKGICVRNSCCEENLILIVFELILKTEIEIVGSFFNPILIVLLFLDVPNIGSSWLPFFFGFYGPGVGFHASLEQRVTFLEPVNVEFDSLLRFRLD